VQFDNPVIVEKSNSSGATVIWLHGLGADGFNFEPIVPELNFPQRDQVRFIFPHANVQPVTLAGGMSLRSWFDIYSLAPENIGNEDMDGMNQANHYIHSLIDEQVSQGIDSTKIVLAGFSQGGAMALYSALTYDKPLAGIMGLSTLLGGSTELEKNRNDANDATPILMTHGRQDEVLAFELGVLSRDMLQRWGYQIEWKEYQTGHHLDSEGITDISNYLGRIL
jgi:phospholipase/carboxylesterase